MVMQGLQGNTIANCPTSIAMPSLCSQGLGKLPRRSCPELGEAKMLPVRVAKTILQCYASRA